MNRCASAACNPPAPTQRDRIQRRLAELESEHNVRVLYAFEFGSRAWGFESAGSDFDVQVLVVHPVSWYLQLGPQPEVIEITAVDGLEFRCWDLRKALGLLRRGNATLADWLQSPVVHQADEAFLAAAREVTARVYQPIRAFHHYNGLAQKNYRENILRDQVQPKEYLYVLRPLLAAAWAERHRSAPPVGFAELVEAMVNGREEGPVRDAIGRLLALKRDTGGKQWVERTLGPQGIVASPGSVLDGLLPALEGYIDAQLARHAAMRHPAEGDVELALLDEFMAATVMGWVGPAARPTT